MKITMMGEKRPANYSEIESCVQELLADGFSIGDLEAEISHDPFDPTAENAQGINMTGYSADIRDVNDGQTMIMTHGFEDKAVLLAALKKVGIEEIIDLSE